MSQVCDRKRTTVRDIAARKGGEPLVCLTAYSALIASLLDEHVDLLLVGDSVATAQHGAPNTVGITLDQMIFHGQSVMRANPKALVALDLPFGSYEASPQQAFETASRVLKETGVDAVKLEGGEKVADTISFLTQNGIPVMAHVGLLPQSYLATGGYRVVGRADEEEARLLQDARAVEEAGAFCVVIEGVVEALARKVSDKISIPTIGIGASAACDGQILVTDDLLGFFDWTPKFARPYANLRAVIKQAVSEYANDVRERSFPSENETYS